MNERFKEPVLFVGDIEDDINLSMPPATGEEYIKRVILEARQCEDVVCAKIDEARLKKPTLNVKPLPECAKAPDYVSPTMEWQHCQLADFSHSRLYIAQIREEITNCNRKKKPMKDKLPDVNDQTRWIDMCTASDEKKTLYIEPTLTVILSMNQPTIEQVLEYLVEYLEEQISIQPPLGRWLYALLSALELPLNPDMCSCLRSLARTCSKMRSQLASSCANDAISLNLFICLVARYFRQLDLADP
ncbi:hypothetical protein TSAR_000424 [Trichomalopsis sarcophagae]|uniref:Gem-associated protein 2 n=1 Tax=Trichomalopsis sarcophagae TaxID=543379 RepID=A0A232FGE2_9HYME|nr:hypothetical protein TSAR_000424 [Trichomalopsis sarcophagae]